MEKQRLNNKAEKRSLSIVVSKCKCDECGWELHGTIKGAKTYDIINKAGITHTIARFESGHLTIMEHKR